MSWRRDRFAFAEASAVTRFFVAFAAAAVGAGTAAGSEAARPVVGPNVRVWTEPNGRPVVEPHLAAHPTNPGRLLAAAMRVTDPARPFETAQLVVFLSADGGSTWKAKEFDAWGYDPAVAFRFSGEAIVSWLGTETRFTHDTPIRIYRSLDGGIEWGEAEIEPGAFDGAKLTIDPATDEVVVTAAAFDMDAGGDHEMSIYVARRRNPSGSSRSFRIDQEGAHASVGGTAALPDGTLVVLGVGGPEAEGLRRSSLWVHRSTDGGVTFSEPIGVSGKSGRRKGYAHIVADTESGPYAGRLYVVRAAGEVDQSGGIWLNRSSDGGRTWSPDARVDPEGGRDGTLQMLPAVAVSREGVLGVSWVGRRRDQTGAWVENRVFFTASLDGGDRFTPAAEVTDVGSNPLTGRNGNVGVEMPGGGHYQGMAARADGAFQLLWSDSRQGVFELFTATVRMDASRRPSGKEEVQLRGDDGAPGRLGGSDGSKRRGNAPRDVQTSARRRGVLD